MSTPWKCPECGVILAPHVSEHRCDPPAAGVTALPFTGGPAGSTGTSISTATLPGTITVNVSGSVTTENELVDLIQRRLTERANRDWSGRNWPLRSGT